MALWLIVPSIIGAVIASIALYLTPGLPPHRIAVALDMTGRWSFVLFWMAYTGSIFGPRMARRRRDFGLAYASAHLVHVALVVWLIAISPRMPESWSLTAFFGGAVGFTYLLAALSWQPVAEWFDKTLIHYLRAVGMNYILLAFAYDFIVNPILTRDFDLDHVIKYGPFAYAVLVAPLWKTFYSQPLRRPDQMV